MPYRSYTREQDWLLPPSLGEWIAVDQAVRFVAQFVDSLDLRALGISEQPAVEGAPAFPPRVLLAAWLYGFMVRVRSSRQIERACQETIPFLWLTAVQRPDHVTLWRFYHRYRPVVRQLLKQTVRLAVAAGLVDFALQAVDGSKVAIGSGDSLCDRAGLEKLLSQVEREIAQLEAAEAGSEPPAQRVRPRVLLGKRLRRARLQQALSVLEQRAAEASPKMLQRARRRQRKAEQKRQAAGASAAPAESTPAPPRAAPTETAPASAPEPATAEAALLARLQVSRSDPEARPLKGRQGFCVGYNGQLVVDGKAQIVVAADVVDSANDQHQLAVMLAEAAAMTGRYPQAVVADTGYSAISDIQAVAAQGIEPYVADQREKRQDGPAKNPYHKAHFIYDADTDSYRCPLGQPLTRYSQTQVNGQLSWSYRGRDCQGCPAQQSGACTKARQRSVTRTGQEAALAAHAAKMQSESARQLLRQRSAIVEPVFSVLREQLGLLRFLVRGLEKVKAEWRLLCVGHNLRKLWKLWWRPKVRAALAAT